MKESRIVSYLHVEEDLKAGIKALVGNLQPKFMEFLKVDF